MRPRASVLTVARAAASACAMVLASTLVAGVASARTHAVLVGVSSYPALARDYQLAGPANDVRLFRELLLERGVAPRNLRLLADGVEGAVLPSRQAILESLAVLAGEVTPGDHVFVLLAGHGSQQPAAAGSAEPDGLDEIFLPRDVGRWQGATGAVRNAITDDELGAALQRLRARGALVWAVFDTCHAGTLARAVALQGQRERYVPPAELGVEPGLLPTARRSRTTPEVGGARPEAAAQAGDFVYSYAAQSHEITPELRQPAYSPLGRVHGLFAYTLHQVLTAGTETSYRQVMERVLQVYLSQGRQAPTPLYEGSMLDAPIFGDAKLRPLQWRVERRGDVLQLRAGELHGVGENSILALTATAAADSPVIGHVKVAGATLSSALLSSIAYAHQPALPLRRVPSGAHARPVLLQTDFRLRVALLPQGSYCEMPRPDLQGAVARLQQDLRSMPRLAWVRAGNPADVYLCQRATGVVVLDVSGEVPDAARRSLPVIPWPAGGRGAVEQLSARIAQQLAGVARVLNLSRVIAAHPQAAPLEATLELQSNCSAGKPCTAAPRTLRPVTALEVCSGDRVTVKLANAGFRPVDVTVLYIDAGYGIKVLYPFAAGEVARFEPKGRQTFSVDLDAQPSGAERLLILAARVSPQAPIVSFADLAQRPLPSLARATGNPLDLWEATPSGLNPLSNGPLNAMRSAVATDVSIGVTTYTWTVLPRDPATAACAVE